MLYLNVVVLYICKHCGNRESFPYTIYTDSALAVHKRIFKIPFSVKPLKLLLLGADKNDATLKIIEATTVEGNRKHVPF